MADTAFGKYLMAVRDRIIGSSTFIADSDNVQLGETYDLMNLPDSAFPRIEIKPLSNSGRNYVDQRNMEFASTVGIIGYIKRDQQDITEQDYLDIIEFAEETRAIVYGLNDDKQAGNTPCPGFMYLSEFPSLEYADELFDKINTFLFTHQAVIYKEDTAII